MKSFHLFILLCATLVLNINFSYADSQEEVIRNAVTYYWGDVVAVNVLLDRDFSIDEIKALSDKIKIDIYYLHDLKRYPVCIINYFTDENKLQKKIDPWEATGWKYEYVINKQMKREFLYTKINGKTKRIQ